MLKANTSEHGQDLMGTWGITAFEPIPRTTRPRRRSELYPTPIAGATARHALSPRRGLFNTTLERNWPTKKGLRQEALYVLVAEL